MKANSLRLVMLSGDWIPLNLPTKIKENFNNAEMVSLGGATEASIWSIYHPILEIKETWKSIPYGEPLANQNFYVLNNEMELCPIGVQGELYIGGVGVAQGYLNDLEKTKNSFIQHSKLGYIYRTGDHGILHKEGYIEFLGRKDQQVKIRGYRIELGEIESQLIKHISIRNAIVIDRTDLNGKKYLCAYIVSDEKIPISELRALLSKQLPEYMIPSYFVYIEKLPLTSNGKIDRNELPEPEEHLTSGVEYMAPENSIEEELANIWKKMLNIKRVGINENFFELGGDSLNATKLVTIIKREFNVEIPLNEIFRAASIKEIAQYIGKEEYKRRVIRIENLVLLRKGAEANKNMFFIHAGSGEIEVYVEICNRLRGAFNYWAIRGDRLEAYGPQNLTIEEIAKKYVDKIKKRQPRGPYYLSGWCAGGTIALEMTRQLEAENEKVEFLALINSLAPQRGLVEDERRFNVETELKTIKQWLPVEGAMDYLRNCISDIKGTDDVWERLIYFIRKNNVSAELIKELLPVELHRLIPNFNQIRQNEELIYYTNVFRTSQMSRAFYIPSNSIKTQVHFFEASQEKVSNKERWNLYCDKPIKIYEIKGDHVSILRIPDVAEGTHAISTVYNNILTSQIEGK